MFAFAIWDNKSKTLFLARDRVGIKPLYYYLGERFLSFGSEIKAILADPAVKTDIAPEVVDRFLRFCTCQAKKRCSRVYSSSRPETICSLRTDGLNSTNTGIWTF